MGTIIGFIIILAILGGLIFTIVDSFLIVWVALKGWIYLLVLIGAIVLLKVVKESIKKHLYNKFTPLQREELKKAKAKLYEEIENHKRKVDDIIDKKRKEIEEKSRFVQEQIQLLENQKALFQENINKNTVLSPLELKARTRFNETELVKGKVFSLIMDLENNRSNSLKEALIKYNKEDAELWSSAQRRYAENIEKQKEERAREEELRLLREQKQKLEELTKKQEEANKKIMKKAEDLLKKEKKS